MLEAGQGLIQALDEANARQCQAQRDMLSLLPQAETEEVWALEGARDLAHWLSIRYGLSSWKAHRWIHAAHALEDLPLLSAALATGELGVDKVLELCRFARPETERRLLKWAQTVSVAAVRRRADREVRTSTQAEIDAHEGRFLEWWYTDEGRRMGLQAELPAAQGAVVVKAIERMTEQVPQMPGEEDAWSLPARRADALVALSSATLAADPDPDRATVVVHASLEALQRGSGGAELEDGSALHPETVRRLLCSGRVQTILEDAAGNVAAVGRLHRDLPAWLVRQVRYRDRECRFPGCGARAFTEAHHLRWWRHGGHTRPREPRVALLVPSPAGPRARVEGRPTDRRHLPMAPTRRDPLSSRSVAGQNS
jgi:hypothetical protein